MKPRFHGALGQPQALGDGFVTHLFQFPQDDNLLEIRGEPLQNLLKVHSEIGRFFAWLLDGNLQNAHGVFMRTRNLPKPPTSPFPA